MNDTQTPTVAFGTTAEVDYSVHIPLDDMCRHHEPNGKHLWTVALVYSVGDPEAAMDDLHLGPDNFIGALYDRFVCLWCKATYDNPGTPGPTCTG